MPGGGEDGFSPKPDRLRQGYGGPPKLGEDELAKAEARRFLYTVFGRTVITVIAVAGLLLGELRAQDSESLPVLTGPVNDLAGVLDETAQREIERLTRALFEATGDTVVVATVETIAPYTTIEEYATKLFENHGKGIGARGKDNGLLLVVAVRDRKMRIEVGYDLEEFVTDGFAGEVQRRHLAPAFRAGDYAGGIRAAVSQLVARIAQARRVTLPDVPSPQPARRTNNDGLPWWVIALILLFMLALSSGRGRRRRRGFWGGGPWSGWHSGAGPFGPTTGGFGGGFGGFGGGGGGGFGGFGGGRSGGGGASGGW